ncbi:MAG TPA: hybrid sensor histidine kinase/response regulator [Pirellulales bacterium]|nr:hybrid sensor histidine kinase/response regulator [Pirellulales bacterium]
MSIPVNVLLVEDDAGDAEVVKRLLAKSTRASFQLEWVQSIDAAEETLQKNGCDVLLLDLGLPPAHDLEGLARLHKEDTRVPIVIVTDQNDETMALRALQEGAQDYLIKGNLTTDNLVRAIRHATERQNLVSRLAEARIILENRNKRLAKLYRTAHKFVDNVSHEFRTPLTVIKEYVSIIRDGIVGDVSDEQRQMLAIVEDRADDLNTMVDDMLDVSKLEAGMLGVYRKRCQAADIVAHVRPALERKASTKGIELEWNIEEGLPCVYCDAEKVGRVLINLSINAIKFCGQPGRVRVSGYRCPDATGVELSVTDNGPGISAENQEAIFRRFKQLSESVRSSTKGFGLGLSIAKELAEANLGEIRVDSRPGRGSTFSFTLPAADAPEIMRRYLHRIGQIRNGPERLSLVQADIDESTSERLSEDVDTFLSCLLRYNDLLLRGGPHRWLIVLPVPESEVASFHQRAKKSLAESNRNRLGEPLPTIHLECLGSWRVASRRQILARLRNILPSVETVYA